MIKILRKTYQYMRQLAQLKPEVDLIKTKRSKAKFRRKPMGWHARICLEMQQSPRIHAYLKKRSEYFL